MLTRRSFLAGAAVGAMACGLGRSVHAQAKPNILYIMADDLGYGDLGAYGAPDMRTPHIDGLVARGMRFDVAYANCPVCSPTRAAFVTGCYPDKVGVPGVIRTHDRDSFGYLEPGVTTVADALRDGGYNTALVGKWHLGLESPNTPNERGFDHFHGFLGDMMDDYYNHRRHDINYMRLNGDEIDPEGHATDLFSEWASEYIRAQADESDPFFLYLAYNAPHTPVQPPEDWTRRVLDREDGIDEDRAKLVALIEHMDDGIGRVLEALDGSGQADHTLIVFTSDNGGFVRVGARNAPWNNGKTTMYEGGIRVPTCAVWPGHIEPGSVSDAVTMTMDWMPTFCELAGAVAPAELDGVSILPVLTGEAAEVGERTLVWMWREGNRYGGHAFYAIRRGRYKLLQDSPFDRFKLFDLEADPGEASPLPESHAQYRELFDALRNHIILAGRVPWSPPGIDPESS
jgi:arylsulfatase A-like enzyme